MRQFFKFTFATVIGCIISFVILVFLCLTIVAGIIATDSDNTLVLNENSVLAVNLSGIITEHSDDNPFNGVMGMAEQQQGLDDIVGAIDKAANTKEISAIYVEAGLVQTDYASLQEIRQALLRAKAKKKLVVSYAKEYTQGTYYVCSVADKVWINPEGMLDLHGLAAQPTFGRAMAATSPEKGGAWADSTRAAPAAWGQTPSGRWSTNGAACGISRISS